MSYLPNHKYGNCSCGCNGKDVAGRKVGKIFYCLDSYTRMKAKEQISKANERNKVRSLPHLSNGEKELIESRNNLIADLDATFSRYVRIMYADDAGIVSCYTCPTSKHYTLMQLSHYISRKHIGLRWDLRNGKVGCEYCNCHLHGNLGVYKERLEEEEPGLADQLLEQSYMVEKPSNDELKSLLIELRSKLKNIELKLKK